MFLRRSQNVTQEGMEFFMLFASQEGVEAAAGLLREVPQTP